MAPPSHSSPASSWNTKQQLSRGNSPRGQLRLIVGMGSVLTLLNGLPYCPRAPFVKCSVPIRSPPCTFSILFPGTHATSLRYWSILDTGNASCLPSLSSHSHSIQSRRSNVEGAPHLEVLSLSSLNFVSCCWVSRALHYLFCLVLHGLFLWRLPGPSHNPNPTSSSSTAATMTSANQWEGTSFSYPWGRTPYVGLQTTGLFWRSGSEADVKERCLYELTGVPLHPPTSSWIVTN